MDKQLVMAVAVPLGILIATVACKCLAKGGQMKWDDFHMGIDVMMAALASGLLYVCEQSYEWSKASHTPDPVEKIKQMDEIFYHFRSGVLYCVMIVAVLVFLLIYHQRSEKMPADPNEGWFSPKNVRLLWVSNAVGFFSLGLILYFVSS